MTCRDEEEMIKYMKYEFLNYHSFAIGNWKTCNGTMTFIACNYSIHFSMVTEILNRLIIVWEIANKFTYRHINYSPL